MRENYLLVIKEGVLPNEQLCFPKAAGRLCRLDQSHESTRCSLNEYSYGNSCYTCERVLSLIFKSPLITQILKKKRNEYSVIFVRLNDMKNLA